MKTFRISAHPWDLAADRLTWDLPEDLSLARLQGLIAGEYDLDEGRRWTFYMSGEFHDSDTAFGPGAGARAIGAALAELSLAPGMRFAYQHDLEEQSRFELSVDAVGDAAGAGPGPTVVARVGAAKPEEPEELEGDGQEDGATPEPAPFPSELVDEVQAICDALEEHEYASLPSELWPRALALIAGVLDACPTSERLQELGDACGCDVEPALDELFRILGPAVPANELEPHERRYARLEAVHLHRHGFDKGLVAEVRFLLQRWDPWGDSAKDRVGRIAPDELERVCEGVLAACPTPGRLAELTCELQGEEVKELLRDRAARAAARLAPGELEVLLERTEAAVGGPMARLEAGAELAEEGQAERAREVLAPLVARVSTLSNAGVLNLAGVLAQAEDLDRAVGLYRGLLAQRWLSGTDRPYAVAGLASALDRLGQAAEAQQVRDAETARREAREQAKREAKEKAARAAAARAAHEEKVKAARGETGRVVHGETVVRQGPKVGRNDPCPCGSGKKAKKCCGTEAVPPAS